MTEVIVCLSQPSPQSSPLPGKGRRKAPVRVESTHETLELDFECLLRFIGVKHFVC